MEALLSGLARKLTSALAGTVSELQIADCGARVRVLVERGRKRKGDIASA